MSIEQQNKPWFNNPGLPIELVSTKYGRMFCPPGDTYVTGSLRMWGVYSETEALILEKLCQDRRVLTAGGNIGAMVIPMATKAEMVLAYEPQPLLYSMLVANISNSRFAHKIYCENKALDDHNGEIRIPMIRTDSDYNMGRFGRDDWSNPEYSKHGVPVKTDDIDQVLNNNLIDFIMLDVEGMELDLLNKSKSYIQAHKPLMWVECDREDSGKSIIEFIYSLDYTPYWFVTPLTPDNCHPANSPWPMQASFNLLCVPPESLFPLPNLPQIKANVTDKIGNCPGDSLIFNVKGLL